MFTYQKLTSHTLLAHRKRYLGLYVSDRRYNYFSNLLCGCLQFNHWSFNAKQTLRRSLCVDQTPAYLSNYNGIVDSGLKF